LKKKSKQKKTLQNLSLKFVQKIKQAKENITKIILKVFEILKNFFQKVFKWGMGQSPKKYVLCSYM